MRILKQWRGDEWGGLKRINEPTVDDVARMKDLLWKYIKEVEAPSYRFEAQHPEILSKDPLDKMFEWEDYAIAHIH